MTPEVCPDGTGIHVKLSRLEDEDLLALNAAALSYPGFESLTHVISDFTKAPQSNLTIACVRQVAEQDAAAVKRNPNMLVAVVANQLVIRGMTNVYRAYFEHAAETPSWKAKYFESLAEARTWLAEQTTQTNASANTSDS